MNLAETPEESNGPTPSQIALQAVAYLNNKFP